MKQQTITNEEIENQSVYYADNWSVLFPKRPVSSYHFLILPVRSDVRQFTELTDDELVSMKYVIDRIVEKTISSETVVNGYNLFSNNGTYEIGQHLSRFHQHIFVRVQDEVESPYVAMAEGRRWFEVGSHEWNKRRDELRSLFNS